jgi:hypothetical protein
MGICRDVQLVTGGIDGDRVRAAGQVDAARQAQRAAARADREHEQRVAAAVGDVAEPRARAGDSRRADARGGRRERGRPGLDRQRARAAVEHRAQAGRERRCGVRRAGGRRQLRAPAAGEEQA